MARKPSEELAEFFKVAKEQPTKTAAFEAADRTEAALTATQGYLRKVEEALVSLAELEVGTPLSAPLAVGAAALYLATDAGSHLDAAQLRQRILDSAATSVNVTCGDDSNPNQLLLDADALLRAR